MTNTNREWLSRPPTGLKVVAYQRECGWHVIVSQTGPSVESTLRPRIVGKCCVPIYAKPDEATVLHQLQAIVIGTHNVIHGDTGDCHNL